jgi:hypothetical protein
MRTVLLLTSGATALALGLGCGDPQVEFAELYVDKYCTAHDDCDRLGRPCPIRLDTEGSVYEECDFDEADAEDCLAATFTCDDTFPENAVVVLPTSCITVCGDAAPPTPAGVGGE